MANKTICEGCPCLNIDYEDGGTCNLNAYVFFGKKDGETVYVSDECTLEFVRFAGGEFRPTLRAVDPPSALAGGGDSEKSAGN